MKEIKTAKFVEGKKKGKKKDNWDPNPWAVCRSRINEDKEPEKLERCIKHVKEKQK